MYQISQLSGETNSYQYMSDKGNTKTKLFCHKCGSVVFGKNSGRPGIKSIYVGTFDDASFVKPTFNVYTSEHFHLFLLMKSWTATQKAIDEQIFL